MDSRSAGVGVLAEKEARTEAIWVTGGHHGGSVDRVTQVRVADRVAALERLVRADQNFAAEFLQ